MNLKKYILLPRFKTSIPYLLIMLTLTVIYFPVISSYYAHHDDYIYALEDAGKKGFTPYAPLEWQIGRYLTPLFYSLYSFFTNSVVDLNLIRFISILILCCGAFVCFKTLRFVKLRALDAYLAAICIFVLPPFQVFVSWAINVGKLPSIIFSCLAFKIVFDWAQEDEPGFKDKIMRSFLSIVLFNCALMSYQPGAMFFWFLTGIILLSPAAKDMKNLKKFARISFSLGCLSMALYFVILQVLKPFFAQWEHSLYYPYKITLNPVDKVLWFIREPLNNALNFWSIFPIPLFIKIMVLFITLGGLSVAFTKQIKPSLKAVAFYLFAPLALIVLSFSPNLLVPGNAAFYRCCIALTPLIFIIVLFSLIRIINLFQKRVGNGVLTFILMGVCVYGALTARDNMVRYRVKPSHNEVTFLSHQLKRGDLYTFDSIEIIRPEKRHFQDKRRYDEFNVPSTFYPQYIGLIIKASLNEIGLEPLFWHFFPHIKSVTSAAKISNSKTLVIDMNQMY